LSSNFSLDPADVRLAAPHAVSPLAAGASVSWTESLSLPVVAPGLWYLLAVADDGRVVTETLEGNNVRYSSLQIGPDLYVSAASVPFTIRAGSSVSVFEAVANQGSPAGASRTRFYLSRNNALDTGDILLEQFREVPALAQGASSSATTALSVPPGLSGSWFLLIVIDADATVAESNEGNNVVPRAVTIVQ
jgi:subtilase family serine protease